MRKALASVIAITMGTFSLIAQPLERPSLPFNISVSGGAAVSFSENAFSYRDNGKTMKLVDPAGSLAFGYDFTNKLGARLSVSYGKNSGACNVLETSTGGFYPFEFKSINVFADALLTLTTTSGGFSPVLYGGIGLGHSSGFTDAGHPWQKVSDPNTVFGFRFGFIARYRLTESFGIFADLCGEAYGDHYSGLAPYKEDHPSGRGYAGFPLDLRGILSFGCTYFF